MREAHVPRIAVVVPCYRERSRVLATLAGIPDIVERIYCVDDGCPERTGDHVEANQSDPRVQVLRHATNQGVGAAVVTGYRCALEDDLDIVVKMDGDGQMDPRLLPNLIEPIVSGRADYTKGNRFFVLDDLEGMPASRVIGNAVLSFMSKLSTGYWRVFDPTNGYTAIHSGALRLLPLKKIAAGYFFESDMLFRLATVRAVVVDVPQRARYRDEQSGLSLLRAVPTFAFRHARNFCARLFYNYFLRDFQLASLEWIFGPAMMIFGLGYGTWHWIDAVSKGVQASAGTVMLSALPLIAGLQLLLSAIGFDVDNQPRVPIHDRLRARPPDGA